MSPQAQLMIHTILQMALPEKNGVEVASSENFMPLTTVRAGSPWRGAVFSCV